MTSELYPRQSTSRQPDFSDRAQSDALDAKIVVLGNSGVGKTCLLQRYVQNSFDPSHTTATTSAFFAAKRVFVDNHKVRLQLWDTAGQERFRSMAPIYYRGANAALLLYDITSYATFEDLKTWLQELKRNCSSDLIIYIVGAKADLYRERQVTSDRIKLTLHAWFPPPPVSRPPTPPVTQSTYIRPRFTSLTNMTTSHSVPFLSSNFRTKSHSQSPPREASPTRTPLKRSNTIMSTAVANESVVPPLIRRRTTSAAPPANQQSQPGQGIAARNHRLPFRQRSPVQMTENRTCNITIPEVPVEDLDSDFGVDLNMRLFEVSAKDDKGVKELFVTLIRSIITKRAVIEQEREIRERNSVYLNNGSLTPTWAAVADSENSSIGSTSRWGTCC